MIDFSSNYDSTLVETKLINDLIVYNKCKFDAFLYGSYFPVIDEYEKLLNARYHKNDRIRQRLVYLCCRYKYIWFCTFTFDNRYINKSMRTKRDIIKSVINDLDFKYILNVDYGKNTQREHYHCILATNIDIDLNDYFQSYYMGGFSFSIQCKSGLDDIRRLSKYINKLVNHCIKATTTKQRIVYNFKGYNIFNNVENRRYFYNKDLNLLQKDT